jgi:hypothetical protein
MVLAQCGISMFLPIWLTVLLIREVEPVVEYWIPDPLWLALIPT